MDELVRSVVRGGAFDPNVSLHGMYVGRYGWPWRSMQSTRRIVQAGSVAITEDNLIERGIAVPKVLNRGDTEVNRIAFLPIWPGFLLNSMLYGGMTMALILGLAGLRSRRRRNRGRCVYCNYDLADLDLCPECGTEVRRKPT